MAGSDRAPASQSGKPDSRNLALRIGSALVLAPLAIAVAYVGGWAFIGFWTIAAIGILWEWMRLVDCGTSWAPFAVGVCVICGSAILLGTGHSFVAIMVVGLGGAGIATVRSDRPAWTAGGVVYAGAILIAPQVLRSDVQFGFFVIMLLFAVVWTTDILGYFIGRAIGGPKLAPSISPNKTWSGAVAGAVVATIAAVMIAKFSGRGDPVFIGCIALVLSSVSQTGDLLESSIKRRFNAKDASALIPGHGGLMDRLDGFWAAANAAALIGVVRAGIDAPARGLVGW